MQQVKPGLPYLDIIRLLRDNSSLPIAAYQVSQFDLAFQFFILIQPNAFQAFVLVKDFDVLSPERTGINTVND